MWISSTEDSSIRARFSAAAKSYDDRAEVQDRVAQRVLELIRCEAVGLQLLEIGCGTGRLTTRILEAFPQAHVTALDLSAAMVEQARSRVARSAEVDWRVGDVCEFEPEERFSTVLSSSALHWVSPFEDAMNALDRLVQPGGRIAVAVMLRESLSELHAARLRAAPQKPPRSRLPSYQELLERSSQFGWQVLECSRHTFTARYESTHQLLQTLRQQGLTGGPVSQSHAPLTRGELSALVRDYDARHAAPDGRVDASYEVGFLHAVSRR